MSCKGFWVLSNDGHQGPTSIRITWFLCKHPSSPDHTMGSGWDPGDIKMLQMQAVLPREGFSVSVLCYHVALSETQSKNNFFSLHKADFCFTVKHNGWGIFRPPQIRKVGQLEFLEGQIKWKYQTGWKVRVFSLKVEKGRDLDPENQEPWGLWDSPNSKPLWLGDVLWNVIQV